jgi:peptidoglycan hydrolase FlgJ
MSQAAPVATDFGQFARLRAAAQNRDPEALKAAARQFEALFLQQMLKSMRASSPGDDLLGGEQSDFYRDLYDQQLALHLAGGKGLGVGDLLLRQLQQSQAQRAVPADGRTAAPAAVSLPATEPTAAPSPAPASAALRERSGFVRELWPHAERAAAALGVSPRTLIAQAALETGWGRHMIRNADGSSSLNFFGIKADKGWQGARTDSATHEYVNGNRHSEQASFRAYGSIAEAFEDYVNFVRGNPRYGAALAHGGSDSRYAEGLQKAGYATDPQYADKIQRVAATTRELSL